LSGAVFRLSRRLRRLLRPCCTYGRSTWGHSVVELLDYLRDVVDVPGELYTYARELDRHYIPSRYPNAFESG
jgi:HEPN domain-containing protein